MKKLLITNKYDWIFPLLLFIIFLISLICLLILYIPNTNSNLSLKTLLIVILSILMLTSLICFLFTFQFIIINKNGIIFRCLICKYSFIKWNEIKSLKLINLNTSSSIVGMKYYHIFIEIQTINDKQNMFNKILYNKKNANILLEFINKYNKKIDITCLTENSNFNSTIKWF